MEGIYYNPKGEKLYEGEFKNEIPKESKNIIIYDDNTNKIYEGEIHDGKYEGFGIEYCPFIKDKILYKGNFKNSLYIIPDIEISVAKEQKFINISKITLFSTGYMPGKTCLTDRFCSMEFREDLLQTIGIEKIEVPFENNNKKYKLIFFDTAGAERFMSISIKNVKYSNMVIYLFDINHDNDYRGIDPTIIDEIKEINENIIIYVVGNKLP